MAVNRSYENKEMIEEMNVLVINNGKIEQIADVRFYMSRSQSASVVYCNAWFFPKKSSESTKSGSGSAGGGGYDKKSSALCGAMYDAGIDHKPFGGQGMSVARDRITEWAKSEGYNVSTIYFT